jgi:hypothetical protein
MAGVLPLPAKKKENGESKNQLYKKLEQEQGIFE